jgi:hypothetical protein
MPHFRHNLPVAVDMPPQQSQLLHEDEDEAPARMRRVISEAEISVSNGNDHRSSSSREYRLRKSSLIG